jgi:hypothetical protein
MATGDLFEIHGCNLLVRFSGALAVQFCSSHSTRLKKRGCLEERTSSIPSTLVLQYQAAEVMPHWVLDALAPLTDTHLPSDLTRV